jgi:hypothetical protein
MAIEAKGAGVTLLIEPLLATMVYPNNEYWSGAILVAVSVHVLVLFEIHQYEVVLSGTVSEAAEEATRFPMTTQTFGGMTILSPLLVSVGV